MRIVGIALPVALAMSTIGYSQTDSKTAKDLVQLCAVVTDNQGHNINDLKKEDFLLKEDGLQQTLDFFSMLRLDGNRSCLASLPGETAPVTLHKETPGAGARPAFSRVVALLVDTPGISHGGMESVKAALKRFVDEQATDQDLVALMTTAGKPGVTGEFTKDKGKLQEGIRKLRPGRAQADSFLTPALCGKVIRREPEAVSLATKIIQSEERTTGSLITDVSNPEAEAASKCMMLLLEAATRRKAVATSIRAAAGRLAAVQGQRIIALISEGFSMIAPGGEVAIADVRPAISSAAHAGVMVYAFDARVALDTRPINLGSVHLTSEMNDSVRDYQHGVALLASQTGGEAFYNLDGLVDHLQRMLDNNRIYYPLAYVPPTDKDPNGYRKITVSIRSHPEYRIRAQKGYVLSDVRRSN